MKATNIELLMLDGLVSQKYIPKGSKDFVQTYFRHSRRRSPRILFYGEDNAGDTAVHEYRLSVVHFKYGNRDGELHRFHVGFSMDLGFVGFLDGNSSGNKSKLLDICKDHDSDAIRDCRVVVLNKKYVMLRLNPFARMYLGEGLYRGEFESYKTQSETIPKSGIIVPARISAKTLKRMGIDDNGWVN